MTDLDAWLKALISTLDKADKQLASEIHAIRRSRSLTPPGAPASRGKPASRQERRALQQSLRNIVLRVGRPVLAVVGGLPQIQFKDDESEVWRSRLQASADRLRAPTRAVGRINVVGLPQFQYVGT